jgi:superfamily II DNA or RNA helicase
MLTRTGYLTKPDPETKKTLTVRPLASGDFPRPASFKVYRESGNHICVPRYFGCETFGNPIDKRPEPSPANITFNGTLREATNQIEATELGVQSLRSIGGGVLTLPCGYGKTSCSLYISSQFKVRTMIVVHKEFLASQWEERIREFCPGSTIGRVQCDRLELENDFVIALIQTMSQRDYAIGTFDSIGMVIVDEAHHVCARSFSQFLFRLCPKYTLGLSATPERKDGLTNLLYWFLGPQFFSVERKSDNASVVSVPFRGPFPPVTTTQYGKLSLPGMITSLVDSVERNALIISTIHDLLKTERNILVLTDRRYHAMYLLSQFAEIGGLYIGGADLDLGSTKRLIFATFALAQEGLDIPKLDTVLLVTPKSDVKQAVGRILRGVTKCAPVVYDIVDHWSVFFAMANKRRAVYRELNFMIDEEPSPQKKCLL